MKRAENYWKVFFWIQLIILQRHKGFFFFILLYNPQDFSLFFFSDVSWTYSGKWIIWVYWWGKMFWKVSQWCWMTTPVWYCALQTAHKSAAAEIKLKSQQFSHWDLLALLCIWSTKSSSQQDVTSSSVLSDSRYNHKCSPLHLFPPRLHRL